MRIQYASDLHLEFADNWRFLRKHPLEVSGDILILAGDIGYLGDQNYENHPFWDWASASYQQVFVVLGNHEFYKYYDLSTMKDGQVGEIRENIHIKGSRIDYWIYGHSHRNIDKSIGGTRCVSNQLGYVFANEHFSFSPTKNIEVA